MIMETPIKQNSKPSYCEIEKWKKLISKTPKKLIYSNSKLKKSNIYEWSIPAYKASIIKKGKFNDNFKTCPLAGNCSKFCYACQGGFNFYSTIISQHQKLNYYINNPLELKEKLIKEIKSKRNLTKFRIHSSGDFFNISYTKWWFSIIKELHNIQFYAYTKQVKMFKETLKNQIPKNLTIIYSYGGKQDNLINKKTDRHAKVFLDINELKKSKYNDTTKTDDNAYNKRIRKIGLVYHGIKKINPTLLRNIK